MFKVKTFYVLALESGSAFYTEAGWEITNDILVAKHFPTKEAALEYTSYITNTRRWVVKKIESYVV